MKKLNDEQKIIVDDILYIKKQKPIKIFASFSNRRCKHMENIHTHVYDANMLQ